MKKSLLFVFSLMFSAAIMAQLPVSQTPQNKKVLLEEFTGIHCQYCPDGHKIAANYAASNPSNVFLINIHQGSYATPGAGEPDFRTTFGDAITGQTSLTGYPAGTVNRHLFAGLSQSTTAPGTAMSRGNWVTAGNQVLAQASYVNVAHADTINLATRELKVVVQVYITGTTAPAALNLNVALIQDNLQGPQTGGATYNPAQMLPNGKYNHMHMLRHLLTGQWGDTITTTEHGTLITRTYTYTLPAAINSVPLEMGDLSVIAFITETHQEVITANKGSMSYVTPPGVFACDLSATNKTVGPGLCEYSVTPKVMVKNLSPSYAADTFNVQYKLNGGTAVVQHYTTPIAAGDSLLVSFPAVTLTSGSTKFDFSVNFTGVTHLLDMSVGNSSTTTPLIFTIPSATFGSKFNENFESVAVKAANPPHAIGYNPDGVAAYVVDKTASGGTVNVGGYGASTKSFYWNFYNIAAGIESSLIYEKLNCSANTGYGMKFNYAYAQYSTENDALKIDYSTNCGQSWTNLFSKAGAALKTANATTSNFSPTATQWKSENVDMSVLDGKNDVMIRISGVSAYGNNLYIDDIQFYNSTNVGIEATSSDLGKISIYPNPAKNNINVDLVLATQSSVKVEVYNVSGQLVISESFGQLTSGSQNMTVNTSNLMDGYYFVKVIANDKVGVTPIVIKK